MWLLKYYIKIRAENVTISEKSSKELFQKIMKSLSR